ncbi:hypothetical protein C4A75_18660 [Brevibacillus laterosporus]|uniref:hypothetical protein n=1 Tax=Brevibacillus laterosporus TaxID=1465 RepID=UPI000CE52AA5|nr:hypothetical protein [Brevibacillus laterosporus]PPA82535.1 hypothetical protein C4A75_18660 [Brevibacillus laterosporus]
MFKLNKILTVSVLAVTLVFPTSAFASEKTDYEPMSSNSTLVINFEDIEMFTPSNEEINRLEKLKQEAVEAGTIQNGIKSATEPKGLKKVMKRAADYFPWGFNYSFKRSLESRVFKVPAETRDIVIHTNSTAEESDISANTFTLELYRSGGIDSYIGSDKMRRNGSDKTTFTNVGEGKYYIYFEKAGDGIEVEGSGVVLPGY